MFYSESKELRQREEISLEEGMGLLWQPGTEVPMSHLFGDRLLLRLGSSKANLTPADSSVSLSTMRGSTPRFSQLPGNLC